MLSVAADMSLVSAVWHYVYVYISTAMLTICVYIGACLCLTLLLPRVYLLNLQEVYFGGKTMCISGYIYGIWGRFTELESAYLGN